MKLQNITRDDNCPKLNLTRYEIVQRWPCAAIGYVHDIRRTGERFEELPNEMIGCADPAVA